MIDFNVFQNLFTSFARKMCHDPRPIFLTTNVDSEFGEDKDTKAPTRVNSVDEEKAALKGMLFATAEAWLNLDAD